MAIKAAAVTAHRADSSVSVSERIRQAYFDRLLCRVFSDGEVSDWVLKGGTGMLARVPNARATMDIDLYLHGHPLDEALADLRRLARVDLGDHFRFEYLRHEQSIAGDQQPYAEGFRVTFQAYLGVKQLQSVRVDLVTGPGCLEATEIVEPANRVNLSRLVTHPYRLYPVANQVADKVCATVATYSTGPSSRERDLVDLVVLATTQTVEAQQLRTAIQAEARRRGLGTVTALTLPPAWGSGYEREARNIPACAQHPAIDDARQLMAAFIDIVLQDDHAQRQWDSATTTWRS
ncbi:MAG: nucleotidyl transferase AbiEii/AbiGii toxin family protein [Candidatus Nanopelagicales bacterium]